MKNKILEELKEEKQKRIDLQKQLKKQIEINHLLDKSLCDTSNVYENQLILNNKLKLKINEQKLNIKSFRIFMNTLKIECKRNDFTADQILDMFDEIIKEVEKIYE